MIKFLLPLSFLSAIPAQAMDVDPIEGRRFGRYPLFQEGNTGAVKGNATLFRTEEGKVYGITCAHCVPYLNSLSFLSTNEKRHENLFTCTSYSLIDNIKVHPLYKENIGKAKKEDSKYDIALFTIHGNPKINSFEGELSTDKPQRPEDWIVNIKSYGPLFAKDGSSYEESIFHDLIARLKFDEEDFFVHSFQARDFYLSFTPTLDGHFTLDSGILSGPEEFNLLQGDSGSLAVNSEGKAIALASRVGADLTKLPLMETFPKELLETEKIDEDCKVSVCQKVKETIANHTKTLKGSSGKEMFLFQLKESLPSIEGNDYYTPLALHSDFINEYIQNISDSSQKNQSEFKIATVNNDSGCENPKLVEKYLNMSLKVNYLSDEVSKIKAEMDPKDLRICDLLCGKKINNIGVRKFDADEKYTGNFDEEDGDYIGHFDEDRNYIGRIDKDGKYIKYRGFDYIGVRKFDTDGKYTGNFDEDEEEIYIGHYAEDGNFIGNFYDNELNYIGNMKFDEGGKYIGNFGEDGSYIGHLYDEDFNYIGKKNFDKGKK